MGELLSEDFEIISRQKEEMINDLMAISSRIRDKGNFQTSDKLNVIIEGLRKLSVDELIEVFEELSIYSDPQKQSVEYDTREDD